MVSLIQWKGVTLSVLLIEWAKLQIKFYQEFKERFYVIESLLLTELYKKLMMSIFCCNFSILILSNPFVMKRLVSFLVFTSLLGLVAAAQSSCLAEGIWFSTQAQIDAFETNYPGCTEIEGDVDVYGADITNFYGLDTLTSIGGTLVFINNSSLTSMPGLENLSYIGGNLEIDDNNALSSLSGLEGLTNISGTLQIRYNDVLDSISGLVNLSSVGGNLWITDNPVVDLTAFENLTSIGGTLGIDQNSELVDLKGLDNIDASTIMSLNIYYNPVLSTCNIKSICDYLSNPDAEFNIYGNSGNCQHAGMITELCTSGIIENGTSLLPLSIYPNPSETGIITVAIDKPRSKYLLACYSSIGKIVYHQLLNENETLIDISHWQPGIYLGILYEDGKMVRNAEFVVQ